jgi:rhodanese-related sulfurtransferase
MNRRSFLATGVGSIAGATLVAGCIGGILGSEGGSGDRTLPGTTPDQERSRAGLAPNPESVDPTPIDVDGLDTTETFGIEVPLLPIDVAYDWYRPQEARFVDARGLSQYEASHVSGAVHSPAPSGYETDDPTEAWQQSGRIVTYCTCPHHLSSERAAVLIDAGYEAVFALDEGFGEWYDREYPMGTSNASTTIGPLRRVSGSVDPAYAGERVQLHHAASEQREPAVIEGDGSFEVTFRFVEVESEDTLILETPAGTRRGTVAEMVEETAR